VAGVVCRARAGSAGGRGSGGRGSAVGVVCRAREGSAGGREWRGQSTPLIVSRDYFII
jgi:hypothetical protein